jgi:hypothetical protein
MNNAVAVIAFLISLISFYISIFGIPGTLQPLKPTGYAIIRGDNSFPSDYIVLPLEWENTSTNPALIRQPKLVLNELDGNGKETGDNYRFLAAGEYPEISADAFSKPFVIKDSFIAESHTVTEKILVFHYERWWDTNDKLYMFRFKGNQKFSVTIEFQVNSESKRQIKLFELPIYLNADQLQINRDKLWWDYFYLDN